MQELTMNEVDEVNGGLLWVAGAATVGAAVAVGAAIGAFGVGYAIGTVIYKTYELATN